MHTTESRGLFLSLLYKQAWGAQEVGEEEEGVGEEDLQETIENDR